jgi:hypothetical protein
MIPGAVAAGVRFEEIASKGGCTFTAATTPRSWRREALGLCRGSAGVSHGRLVV